MFFSTFTANCSDMHAIVVGFFAKKKPLQQVICFMGSSATENSRAERAYLLHQCLTDSNSASASPHFTVQTFNKNLFPYLCIAECFSL